jgi:outer membrane lipoprotein SlyB
MAATTPAGQAIVLAVFADHASAEEAVCQLHQEGFPVEELSIIGKDFQVIEQPLRPVSIGTAAWECAMVGAWTGGLFGLLVGTAFLPEAGPLVASLLGGVAGALAGAVFGGLTGAIVGLVLSSEKASHREPQIKAGKFLVTVRGDEQQIERAQAVLAAEAVQAA